MFPAQIFLIDAGDLLHKGRVHFFFYSCSVAREGVLCASALDSYMACVVSWAIDGKLLTPRASVFSLWTEALGSSRLWLLGTGKAICCHHCGPFAACPPPAERLTSDQNFHCLLSRLLFCLGFCLFIQQEMFPGLTVFLFSCPQSSSEPGHQHTWPFSL